MGSAASGLAAGLLSRRGGSKFVCHRDNAETGDWAIVVAGNDSGVGRKRDLDIAGKYFSGKPCQLEDVRGLRFQTGRPEEAHRQVGWVVAGYGDGGEKVDEGRAGIASHSLETREKNRAGLWASPIQFEQTYKLETEVNTELAPGGTGSSGARRVDEALRVTELVRRSDITAEVATVVGSVREIERLRHELHVEALADANSLSKAHIELEERIAAQRIVLSDRAVTGDVVAKASSLIVPGECEEVGGIAGRDHNCGSGSTTWVQRVIGVAQLVRPRRPELHDRSDLEPVWQLKRTADGDVMAFVIRRWTPFHWIKRAITISSVVAEDGVWTAAGVIAIRPSQRVVGIE